VDHVPCGLGLVWHGDHCVAADCAAAAEGIPCVLGDGGYAACYGDRCQTLDFKNDGQNCGGFGRICPESSCIPGPTHYFVPTHCDLWCSGADCNLPCGGKACPAGTACGSTDWICARTSCNSSDVEAPCLIPGDAGQLGSCCGSSCISSFRTPEHCGGCGVTCPSGDFCDRGGLLDPSGGCNNVGCLGPVYGIPTCTPIPNCAVAAGHDCPLPGGGIGACCQGACVDLSMDPLNCGICGLVCALGSSCGPTYGFISGSCSGPPACNLDGGCPAGRSCPASPNPYSHKSECVLTSCTPADEGLPCVQGFCCGASCSDLTTDSQNCGSCGHRCGPGEFCSYSTCGPGHCAGQADKFFFSIYGSCTLPDGDAGSCCSGLCVSTANDALNCSGCGIICPLSASCQQGCRVDDGGAASCAALGCETGKECLPDGTCAATVCNAYGTACARPGSDGGFQPGNCCGSSCIDSYRSSCSVIECAGVPDGVTCAFGPSSGQYRVCCAGSCVDLAQDPGNCGACGVTCASGICSGGQGVLVEGFAQSFGSGCFPVASTNDCTVSCAPGSICAQGTCFNSLCPDAKAYCQAADGKLGMCCGGAACDDPANDPLNCGGCGIQCPAGQTCSSGVCSGSTAPCGAGHIGRFCDVDGGIMTKVCCPGAGCVDVASDPNNCGTCGTACSAGHACQRGACQ
jgi:hypothetical protein